jgi:hypothetical protein
MGRHRWTWLGYFVWVLGCIAAAVIHDLARGPIPPPPPFPADLPEPSPAYFCHGFDLLCSLKSLFWIAAALIRLTLGPLGLPSSE